MCRGGVEVALSGCCYAEGDVRLGAAHWAALLAVRGGSKAQYFVGVGDGEGVLAEVAVGVHGVEVPFGRVDLEVMVWIARPWQGLQERPFAVEGDLDLAPVLQPSPGLDALCRQLDADASLSGFFHSVFACGHNPGGSRRW